MGPQPRAPAGAAAPGADVDSLNVSVAAGILLHHFLVPRPGGGGSSSGGGSGSGAES